MNSLFGRFIPTDSFIARLDPRTKIIIDFFFVIVLFLTQSWLDYALLALFVICGIIFSKIPFKIYLSGLKSIIFLVIFMILVQFLLTPPINQADILFKFGWFKISMSALNNAAIFALRFFFMILVTTLMTATTAPTAIADGIASLLKPLGKLGLDTKTFALLISMSLRFVPILSDEFATIVDAQRSRGLSLRTGGLIKRVKALIPMIIPLISVAFNKALALADTMEVRGFVNAKNRTSFHHLHFQILDWLILTVFFVMLFWIVI
ncbi:energy-coupling factor transporter transmembrane component T family protein [Oenococcus kitaharae]|uniref:ECF transporter transmembrane component n=1 Tax=Oenococcus kitaharae DSM 17330 TaxID=1045004 RepID=G9WFK5_9LACO|nr:energy-coupling factor transporter transmembrane component T [Oenococcus kitaharae]EHN59162.1 ECF transporter transmembrane component [Oenococcus kitaharae DSM 17330]OEY81962.1 cobalt ABC transporter permease [Oenococcus kitaharae]OEY82333.1 cobalt ABC transporter permease [Oenococcus kitaharae]OEY82739.1 cobalt ABC transporter permease [Oenococcus kitaharae]